MIDAQIKAKSREWISAMKAHGHIPIMNGGRLDIFASSGTGHNGPGCKSCGWKCCWHCTDSSNIPACAKPQRAAA